MSRAGAPRAKAGVPKWVGEPLITLEGGPYSGRWYRADDWAGMQLAAERMQPHCATPLHTTRYVETKRRKNHPGIYREGVPAGIASGTVWAYQSGSVTP